MLVVPNCIEWYMYWQNLSPSLGSYVCGVCGKKYKYYNCFQTHVRAHRGKRWSQNVMHKNISRERDTHRERENGLILISSALQNLRAWLRICNQRPTVSSLFTFISIFFFHMFCSAARWLVPWPHSAEVMDLTICRDIKIHKRVEPKRPFEWVDHRGCNKLW